MMGPVFSLSGYSDVDAVAEAGRRLGYSADYIQLQRGLYGLQMGVRQVGHLSVLYKSVDLGTEIRSSPASGHATFLFPADPPGFRLNGEDSGTAAFFFIPAGCEIDLVFPRSSALYSVTANWRWLERILTVRGMNDEALRGSSVLKFDAVPAEAARFAVLLRTMTQRELESSACNDLEGLFVDQIVDRWLTRSPNKSVHWRDGTPSRKVLSRVKEYLMDHVDERIHTENLALYAGASERSLQRLFLREFGLTPQEYIKVRRLEFARQEIVAKAGDGSSMLTIAYNNGFGHPGRFSADFRAHFGVLPSELRNIAASPKGRAHG